MVLNLPPGFTALLLLVILNIAISIASIHVNKETLAWYFTKSSTLFRAKVTTAIALPFWIWAMYKVIHNGDHDLGAITFALVMISCVFVIISTNQSNGVSQRQLNQLLKRTSPIMLLISNILLTCNYLLPIFMMSLPWSFNVYLVVGAVYWAYMGVWNWKAHLMEGTTTANAEYRPVA